MLRIYCVVGTEFLYIMQVNFSLQWLILVGIELTYCYIEVHLNSSIWFALATEIETCFRLHIVNRKQ